MCCSSCKSSDQTEFTAEMIIHFRGLRNVDHPGVLLVQEIKVCLRCGYSLFTTPGAELAQLASRC